MADTCLRLHLPIWALSVLGRATGKWESTALAKELVTFARHPTGAYNRAVLPWALSYGSPTLLRRAIASLATADTDEWILKIIRKADPNLLLPYEHTVPDYQMFQITTSEPRNALICFAGHALRLSIPVNLFHLAAATRFDLAIYLRDPRKSRYESGIPGLGGNLGEVADALRDRIPTACAVSVLGTSGGGIAAARVANALQARRLALFSPQMMRHMPDAIDARAISRIEDIKLFFAAGHPTDRQRAGDWSAVVPHRAIEWLDTSSHGTLKYLASTGKLDSLVDWLAATQSGRWRDVNAPATAACL